MCPIHSFAAANEWVGSHKITPICGCPMSLASGNVGDFAGSQTRSGAPHLAFEMWENNSFKSIAVILSESA